MAEILFSLEELLSGCAELKAKGRFSPGFDKMTPEAAELWLQINGEQLCHRLNSGKYTVMPAVGFNVAKADGRCRRLAKLTAIDTIVQSVTAKKLAGECAERFSAFSFAYQKGKGAGGALRQYCEYASVHSFAAKIVPSACFDSIDHTILEKALRRFFFHRKTVDLLMSFVKMPVVLEGRLTDRSRGILQGSPISGLFCNLYFHDLDLALEENGIPFVRYADDVVVFADSPEKAKEANDFVISYLEQNLRLKANRSKGAIAASDRLTYLGHSFLRDKTGVIQIGAGQKSASALYEWNRERPRNHRNSVDVLSSGILRQKDYSALFESETEKTVIPLQTVERVNIFSSVMFDSGFLEKALSAGVYVNVFDKNCTFIGRFCPSGPLKDHRLIFEQLTAYHDEKQRLAIAKEFDLASVHNLRLNIRYYNKQHEHDVYQRALTAIDALYAKMKACESYERLLTTEAQIRGLYYSCFDAFIQNPYFHFGVRSKRPPLNAVNAMISFGNTVLYNYIATELYRSSLDIRIGFLHATNRREESLNLDIAEIFRPLVVDRVVFALINRKEITPDRFEYEENGATYLNEEGKRTFLRCFYEKLNATILIKEQRYSYAALIDLEIQKLTRRFRTGETYRAYRQVR